MLKQTLQQKLLQKLSPQQIQLMKLLQVTTAELEQRIKEEIEINPALEEGEEELPPDKDEFEELENDQSEEYEDKDKSRDDFDLDQYIDDDEIPAYKLSVKNTGEDDERREIPLTGSISFQDQLISQLGMRMLSDDNYLIAETIIGNIDDDGYLRREISALVDDLAFSQNLIVKEEDIIDVLEMIQEFDPAGVGARNLQECLWIQAMRKIKDEPLHRDAYIIAEKILDKCMDEFSKKHFDKVKHKLNLTDEQLKDAVNAILHLNPRPGNSGFEGKKSIQHLIPDFILNNIEGELELLLNSRNAPELRISQTYKDMISDYSKSKINSKEKKEALTFVKHKIDSAAWFIDAIKERQRTLLLTMSEILNQQKEYFLSGDDTKLRPMVLKDIAEKIGLDISTVSRVANSKYIQTNFGTILLKSLFSESLSTDSGEEVSSKEVKRILMNAIDAEDKKVPLPDEKLCDILKEKGYNIARRTVAKYREQLNIPVARLRKEL